MRHSPLNAALVAYEENAASRMFRVKVSVFLVGFRTSILNRSGL